MSLTELPLTEWSPPALEIPSVPNTPDPAQTVAPRPGPRRGRLGLVIALLFGVLIAGTPLGIVYVSAAEDRDSYEEDLKQTKQRLSQAEKGRSEAVASLAEVEDDLAAAEESLTQTRAALRETEGRSAAQIEACSNVAVLMEDSMNERILQGNDLTTAVDLAIDLGSPTAFGRVLDSARMHANEADRLYGEAVAAFDTCLNG